MKKHILLLALLGIAGCVPGCAGQLSLNDAYVSADRKTKTALEPHLETAKKADPGSTQSIDDTMQAWEIRLKAAEAARPAAK